MSSVDIATNFLKFKFYQICNICVFVEGCGRVPATPAPTPSPTPTEPTVNGSVRSKPCSGEETNRTACLNGGTCFVLVIEDERQTSCL